MPEFQNFVLDTSLFVNPETQKHFGKSTEQAVDNFLDMTQNNRLKIFMPVSVFRELAHFADKKVLARFRKEAVVKAPDLHNLRIPAAIMHTFIRDLRHRINQGLRIAEKAIHSENIPDNIRKVRQKYREAMRCGIVDSVEDLDVVLLAKEAEAAILSADQGIVNMAEELGLEVFTAADFCNRFA